MAHPHAGIRQGKVERSRVSKLTGGYAKGGKVIDPSTSAKKALKKAGVKTKILEMDGEKPKQRMDRMGRKKGGRVNKGGKTVVNVITGGGHPAAGVAPPMPMPPPGGPPPMGAPGLAAKPPMMPPGPPAGGPPGMAPGPVPPMRKRGGRVNDGTKVFNHSRKEALEDPVKHDLGKNDLKDMNRKRVVTFKTGGGVVKFRASGGRVEAPQHKGSDRTINAKQGVAKATMLPGGAGGGEGRLKKTAMAKRK